MFSNLHGASEGDYKSIGNGNWTDISVWQRYNGSTWVNATSYPTSADGAIEISAGNLILINTALTIDQLNIIGTLQYSANNQNFTLNNGAGNDLIISNGGTFIMAATGSSGGWVISSSATWQIQNGGTYVHNTARAISAALNACTQDAGSTFIYRGNSSLTPANTVSGRTYRNLKFEGSVSSKMTININSGSSSFTVNEKLTIGPDTEILINKDNFTGAINFNGDIDILSNSYLLANTFTINPGKTMNIYSGGTFLLNNSKSLYINGTLKSSHDGIANGGTINVNSTGIYQHDNVGQTIPTMTWNTGSTLKITGVTSGITYIPASCQNVIWDCPNQSSNVSFLNNAITNVFGDLTIVNTGSGSISNATSNSPQELVLWGGLNIQGGNYFVTQASNSVNQTLTVTNDANISGGTFKISGSTSSGTATLNLDGNLIISGGNLTLSSSNTASGTLNLKGNINHTAGTINETGSAATKIKLYGTTAQTISTIGFESNSTIDIELNNSLGASLSSNLNTLGSFTFTSGKFNLSNYNLSLGSTSSITGNSTSMYFISNGVGSLTRKGVTTNLIEFPIGTSSYYSPVSVTNSDLTSDDFTASVVTDATGTNSGSNRVKLLWEIHGTRASFNNGITLKLGWMAASEGPNFASNRNTYAKMWHIEGSNWIEAGTGAYTLNTSAQPYTLSKSGINSLSPFATGQNETALPVTLSSFSQTIKDNNITLFWTTASEINNSGFDVERKSNISNWQTVASIKGKGNSNISVNYTYSDINLNTGKYYYRLKQKDFNGNFSYFDLQNTVEIKPPNSFSLSQNYPNPFNSETIIKFSLPENTYLSLVLYDCLGKLVKTMTNRYYQAGYHSLSLKSNEISSGIYFYQIKTSSGVLTKKLMIIK